MRHTLYTFFFFINVVCVLAQGDAADVYTQANHSTVDHYKFDPRYDYLVLASSFSKDSIEKIPFSDRRIVKIDLIHTTFSETASFDQEQLDRSRLERLIALNPQVVVNQFFEWNIIGQTGCNTSESCLEFFHGFVIYYEEYFTKETAKSEIDSIKTDLSKLSDQIIELKDELILDYRRINCEYPESRYSMEYLSDQLKKVYDCSESYKGRVFFDVDMDHAGRVREVKIKGNLFPCKKQLAKALKYILQWKGGLTIDDTNYDLVAHGSVSFPLRSESISASRFEIADHLKKQYHMLQQYSKCVAYEVDTSFAPILPKVIKKVVSEVFFRNQLDPDLIVVDVTGSMYPYTADLLKWLRLSSVTRNREFVFFNDGDDKATAQKVVGETGGLYHISASAFTEVRNKMFEAMRNGGGGDYPENNCEALLFGTSFLEQQGEKVMIADNYAFPRDISLLTSYQGSLRIILCHTEKGINTRYLDLARQYGFSIHTLYTDLTDLNKSEVMVDGVRYRYLANKFVRYSKG